MPPFDEIPDPPDGYTHRPEAPFEDQVADWFRAKYGAENVEQQHYQSGPRWFCDILVNTDHIRLFIETESRASEVRSGLAQALGYAAEDPAFGVPMVVAPVGHLPTDSERLNRLRQSTVVPILTFDPERGVFLDDIQTEEDAPPSSTDGGVPVPTDKENWKPARKIPVEVDYKGPFYTTGPVDTLEGEYEIDQQYASKGYVLIRGVDGEIYPCRLDVFKRTYKYAPFDEPV